VADPCPDCRGGGRAKKRRVLTVHVPPGVRDGQIVRARGEGEPSADGTSRGDLHCYIRVLPHPMLVRQGDDLLCQVPITFTQAALGGKTEAPTLSGPEEITIPPGAQHGDVVTLKKRGLPSPRSARPGDLHVQLLIEIPRKLTAAQRKCLEEYAKTEDAAVLPQRKSFLDRLKECFANTKK